VRWGHRLFTTAALRRGLRHVVMALPLVLGLLHATDFWRLDTIDRLEARVYDARLKALMPNTLDDRIVIVDIDEKSLAEIGRWPWSRHHMAKLVQHLFDTQGIAAMGMDVVYAEPDDSSGLTQLQALSQGALKHQPGFAHQVLTLQKALDYDQLFADAMAQRRVVMGYYLTSDRDGRQSGQLPAPVLTPADLGQRHFQATSWNGYGANIAKLAQAAPHAGFFNPVVDVDGVVRSLPMLAEHKGAYYESLSLAVFRALLDMPSVRAGFPAGHFTDTDYPRLESVNLLLGPDQAIPIPVDHQAAVLVPYRGAGGPSGGSFQYIPASDLLLERIPPKTLQDKVVLLGTTAPGLMDMRVTPVGEVYPGVETHANVLSGLLDGHLPLRPDYAMGYEVVLLLAVGTALFLGLPRLSALGAVGLSAALAGGLVGLNVWFYVGTGLVMPLATPLLVTIGVFALHMIYGYFVESRSKRNLAQLFGTYVPPELVDEMVKQPEDYSMQATERELTVMFSDMRGFTALSETLTPQALQTLLNQLFSELTQVIRAQRGTIDKYMGDCVMAFWGAPVASDRHAAQAVSAALGMRQAMVAFNRSQTERGLPAVGMGIGLNTGPMFVGDMGSDVRRSSTVIGDAVNLGSRLEGLSKLYGVDVVVSDSTRQQAGEGFIWQELDKVKVKGKQEAVTIHTVLGPSADQTPALDAELELWQRCLQLYRQQEWAQTLDLLNNLQKCAPDKGLYPLYQQRVLDMQTRPPVPNWDGSTQFDTK